jgi:uncharacterized protein (DUF1778 family)
MDKLLQFRLAGEDFAAIKAAASNERISVGAFVRRAALEHARATGFAPEEARSGLLASAE